VLHGEPSNRHPVDLLDSRRAFVTPRHVVARAGRDDLYLGVRRQAFGDIAGVEFRAAVDVRAVALDDDCDTH
jgi:hypothetical protein